MTVLIIRPLDSAKELCQQLAQFGISAVPFPLIELSLNSQLSMNDYHLWQRSDIVISVSKPAAQFANQWLTHIGQNWPITPKYLAVGEASANCLKQYHPQPVSFPLEEDSEHLLQLPYLRNVAGKTITILRGTNGRELLYQTLTQRGATVYYIDSYFRTPVKWDVEQKIGQWQKIPITQLVITSGEQLKLLTDNTNLKQFTWLLSQQIFVPSIRIRQMACDLGFQHVIVTKKADNQTLLKYLTMKTTGSSHGK